MTDDANNVNERQQNLHSVLSDPYYWMNVLHLPFRMPLARDHYTPPILARIGASSPMTVVPPVSASTTPDLGQEPEPALPPRTPPPLLPPPSALLSPTLFAIDPNIFNDTDADARIQPYDEDEVELDPDAARDTSLYTRGELVDDLDTQLEQLKNSFVVLNWRRGRGRGLRSARAPSPGSHATGYFGVDPPPLRSARMPQRWDSLLQAVPSDSSQSLLDDDTNRCSSVREYYPLVHHQLEFDSWESHHPPHITPAMYSFDLSSIPTYWDEEIPPVPLPYLIIAALNGVPSGMLTEREVKLALIRRFRFFADRLARNSRWQISVNWILNHYACFECVDRAPTPDDDGCGYRVWGFFSYQALIQDCIEESTDDDDDYYDNYDDDDTYPIIHEFPRALSTLLPIDYGESIRSLPLMREAQKCRVLRSERAGRTDAVQSDTYSGEKTQSARAEGSLGGEEEPPVNTSADGDGDMLSEADGNGNEVGTC